MKFLVDTKLMTIDEFDHTLVPHYCVQPVGLETEKGELVVIDQYPDEDVKFYFLTYDTDYIYDKDDVILLAHIRSMWFFVTFNAYNEIEFTRITKQNSGSEQYVTVSTKDENLYVGGTVTIAHNTYKIVLPNGSLYEYGGEAYMSISKTKSTRNIVIILSVTAWFVLSFLFLFFLNNSIVM